MAAALLALLLVLLLDQSDRAQRLAAAPGTGGIALAFCVAVPAGIVAAGGALVAPTMRPEPRLLLLALTMILGGAAMLWRPRAPIRSDSEKFVLVRLFLARLTDRGAFALFGVAAQTGQGWAAAFGGIAGGLAALLPASLLGARYAAVVPLAPICMASGAILLMAGTVCALLALGLL